MTSKELVNDSALQRVVLVLFDMTRDLRDVFTVFVRLALALLLLSLPNGVCKQTQALISWSREGPLTGAPLLEALGRQLSEERADALRGTFLVFVAFCWFL